MKAMTKQRRVRRFGVALGVFVVFMAIELLGAERALALSTGPYGLRSSRASSWDAGGGRVARSRVGSGIVTRSNARGLDFIYFEGDPWFTAADVSGHGLSLTLLEGEDAFDDFSLTTATGKLPGRSLAKGYAQDVWTLTNASSLDYKNVLLLITFAYVGPNYQNLGIGTDGMSLIQVGDYFIATFELGDVAAGESADLLLKYRAPRGFELAPPGTDFTYNPPVVQYLMYATAAPIPEPASVLLFGIGVVGLAVYGRRR